MMPNRTREAVVGPENGPAPPFPLKFGGKVIKGFGRGSKDLGIPTANISLSGLTIGGQAELENGIYYGWAGLDSIAPFTSSTRSDTSTFAHMSSTTEKAKTLTSDVSLVLHVSDEESLSEEEELSEGNRRGMVYPMVMSVGWNPYYKNTVRSAEVHIMHHFHQDFYGRHLNVAILGFIRPECDYVSKESLIDDIKTDIEVARRSLARPAYYKLTRDKFLLTFPDRRRIETDGSSNL